MHEPPWLVRITVELLASGEPVVMALVATGHPKLTCFPRSVDGIKVIVEVQTDSGSSR